MEGCKGSYWTSKEDAVLMDNYYERGAERCAAMLPGRTRAACVRRVERIRFEKSAENQKIRLIYVRGAEGGNAGTLEIPKRFKMINDPVRAEAIFIIGRADEMSLANVNDRKIIKAVMCGIPIRFADDEKAFETLIFGVETKEGL